MAWVCAAQLVAPSLFILFFSDRGFDITNGVLTDGKLVLVPGTTTPAPGDPVTGMNWFWMIVLATAGQAMAWPFVQQGLIRLDTTIVAGLLLLSPATTVAIIAPIMFDERPSFL